ncbi:hypothetical protein P154DRAFT_460427 [Amniculicola lignicola CBS 123094]|uniref:Flap structure-specific endonuclease n=1 Tax=Amniculicola lignicola CBS 123094 TaxID=1392246 RepID=A0A6A5WU52_9PLEO|nr:hypothetical protein P154DRAFT_460427 [Amniculicola lignicola CBS 123094]
MGIHGIYKEIGPGERIALSKFAVEQFEETGRPLCIAIDVSIWLFQIQASKGGTNPALRTFYYRLLRLIALAINPIFVFDGPNKPPFKRNKRTGPNVASIPEFLAKQLLKQFGFPIHLAPGEAEAECALLQREGIVDAVLSEDVDTMMFGSGMTMRNWSPEQKTGKTPTHVNIYDAVKTKNGPSGLDRDGMILVALMSGGDYVPEGIPGCGPKTACEAARAGFGRDLCKIARGDTRAIQAWKERLQHELKTNENKLFKRKHGALNIPDDFPRPDILRYYTHPAISNQAGLDKLRNSIKWDQPLDYPGLRTFTGDAFDWVKLEGAKHFVRSLAPSLLVRSLRMRAERCSFSPDDLQAIQDDEAVLIKGIHGKRQHAITDSTTELRVSFVPIDLVNIDLTTEEPDEDGDALTLQDEDADEVPIEIDDGDEEGPKKRGPTKFDPSKPARAWVLESFVKVGVPLRVQDWEAGLLKPKRVAATKATSKAAPKAKALRRAKTTGAVTQPPINSFAKVTKPGVRPIPGLTKERSSGDERMSPIRDLASISAPKISAQKTVINLLSSSPAKVMSTAPAQQAKVPSLSPLPELPSSVTKRRRGPLQRSRTLPTDHRTTLHRPSTPPVPDAIETLDLVSSPALPSPSKLPAKKPRTRATRNPPVSRTTQQNSIPSPPGKARQMTLDTWCSSPAASPSKLRNVQLPSSTAPIPAPPQFQAATAEIETLDLTFSTSPKATTSSRTTNPRRTSATSPARPPLRSISSNASKSSSSSRPNSSTSMSKITTRPRRTSSRLSKTASPEIETLDLTLDSSPAPCASRLMHPPSKPPHPESPPPSHTSTSSLRRSPRNHTTRENSTSPPAAWKNRSKKKREIVLRKSLAGTWTFAEAESFVEDGDGSGGVGTGEGGDGQVLKGKQRRRWRESEIEVLDMCD